MAKDRQVFLEHMGIVGEEKVVEEARNEVLETCKRHRFVVEMQCQEGRTE